MRTKVVRIEQTEFNQEEVYGKINSVISKLEKDRLKIVDVRIAVGRDLE